MKLMQFKGMSDKDMEESEDMLKKSQELGAKRKAAKAAKANEAMHSQMEAEHGSMDRKAMQPVRRTERGAYDGVDTGNLIGAGIDEDG